VSRYSKLLKSRDKWKEKAARRAAENRYLRSELTRVKRERDKFKDEGKEAQKRRSEDKDDEETMPAISSKEDFVFIALQLFCMARIGFRAVSRVLGVLRRHLGLAKAPCPQTVINWVERLSIARMQSRCLPIPAASPGAPPCRGLIWILDMTITLGGLKILCVLGIEADYYAGRTKGEDKAPSLGDVRCLGVSVAASWNGEEIAQLLLKVIDGAGRPVAFLKDGGTDLAKAVKILGEQGHAASSIDDVSHVVANPLKNYYGSHPLFQTFISACGQVSRKFKLSILACLAPPKVSTKSRFMNLHRLVVWADRLLKHSPAGRAAKGSLLEKLRGSLDRIPQCKSFIGGFLRDAVPLLECRKILKIKGLSEESAGQCRSLLESLPPYSPVRLGFLEWLESQLQIARELELAETGLPASSDSIESLFGVAKTLGAGEVKNAHRIAARLPILCGEVTREDARRVLKASVAQQKELMKGFPSLVAQRRQILSRPGHLEDLASSSMPRRFELIAGVQNCSKNSEFNRMSMPYANDSDPVIRGSDKTLSSSDGCVPCFAAAG